MMKYARFVPIALCVCLVAMLAAVPVVGQGRYAAWVQSWSFGMLVAALVLGAVSMVLALWYRPLYEQGKHPLVYEGAVVFLGVFFLASAGVLGMTTYQALTGQGAGSQAGFASAASSTSSQSSDASSVASGPLAEQPGFRVLTLDQLRAYLDPQSAQAQDESLVYFGREDCGGCEHFVVAASPKLLETARELPGIDTAEARSTYGADEVDEVLRQFGISQVPEVLVMKGGQAIQRYDSPLSDVDEIISRAPAASSSADGLSVDGSSVGSESPSSSSARSTQCDDGDPDCEA